MFIDIIVGHGKWLLNTGSLFIDIIYGHGKWLLHTGALFIDIIYGHGKWLLHTGVLFIDIIVGHGKWLLHTGALFIDIIVAMGSGCCTQVLFIADQNYNKRYSSNIGKNPSRWSQYSGRHAVLNGLETSNVLITDQQLTCTLGTDKVWPWGKVRGERERWWDMGGGREGKGIRFDPWVLGKVWS